MNPPADPVQVPVEFDELVEIDIIADALARLCQQFRESQ